MLVPGGADGKYGDILKFNGASIERLTYLQEWNDRNWSRGK